METVLKNWVVQAKDYETASLADKRQAESSKLAKNGQIVQKQDTREAESSKTASLADKRLAES